MPRSNRCVVVFCKSSCCERSFHEFPSDQNLRQKWFNNLNLSKDQQETLRDRAVICSIHFERGCFKTSILGRNLLKRGSVPTLYLSETVSYPDAALYASPSKIPRFDSASISSINLFNNSDNVNCTDSSNTHLNPISYEFNATLPLSFTTVSSRDQRLSYNTDASTQVNLISQEAVEEYKKEIKTLKLKIKRLTETNKLQTTKIQEMEKIKDIGNCAKIAIIKKDAENNNLYATFLLDQLFNYSNKKPRFSETTIRNCVMWRISSPKGYEYCRTTLLKLPSRRTLQRYMGSKTNVTELIKLRLKEECNSLTPIERICSLVIEDMAIKEKLHYSRTEDKFYGLETARHIRMSKKPKLANKMLCFVIHGLSTKFTIPVSYIFDRQMSTAEFYQLTLTVLKQLHICGFVVLRIVTDNHKSNVGLFKALGNKGLKIRVEHPIEPTIPLFLSFDYCHAVKNARNIFLDHDMQAEDGRISSSYLKDLYKVQRNLIIKPVRFLTEKHLYPSNFEKMNVRRAVEIFSPPLTAALKYLSKYRTSSFDFSNASPTIAYMETMYMFFQLHDVSDRIQHIKQLDSKCAPYVNVTDERLDWLTITFPAYIQSIQEYSTRNKLKGLTRETAEALTFTAKSTAACIRYLLEESGFYYVLTRSFSSDAIESMFSNVRMRGGSQDVTDAQAAHNAIKRIIQCGLIKSAASANISADCSYISNIGHLQEIASELTSTTLNFDDLPEEVQESINDLANLCTSLHYGIVSASVAFLAGYIARTIEERIECVTCLNSLLTISGTNPLLALINLQDKGALKYPTLRFTYLINQLIKVVLNISQYFPIDSNPAEILTSLLFLPPASSNFFICLEHKKEICKIILNKLLRPILANIAKTSTDSGSSTCALSSKPLSRKVLKL